MNSGSPERRTLTAIEQSIMDCSSCYASQDQAAEANDIANCQDQNINSVRSSCNTLESLGLIRNVKAQGTRRNKYVPTESGSEYVISDMVCPTAGPSPKERPLTSIAQKILSCSVCIDSQGGAIGISLLKNCNPHLSYGTGSYELKMLAERGFLTPEGIKGGQNTYALTDKTLELSSDNIPVPATCSNTTQLQKGKELELTQLQKRLLECTGCITAQNRRADVDSLQFCTGRPLVTVAKNLRKLASAGKLQDSSPGEGSVALPGRGLIGRAYELTDDVPRKKKGDCNIVDYLETRSYARLSEERKRMLTCFNCITDRMADDPRLPGVSLALLERCTGLDSGVASAFLRELIELKYVKQEQGFTPQTYGRYFVTPNVGMKPILELHRQATANTAQDCHIDAGYLANPPVRVSDQVIECVGCTWTQQIASGKKPAASVNRVAKCRGLDYERLVESILPDMIDANYFRTTKASRGRALEPTDRLRILLGYSASCSARVQNSIDPSLLKEVEVDDLTDYNLDNSFDEQATEQDHPQEDLVISTSMTNERTLSDFEVFVQELREEEFDSGLANVDWTSQFSRLTRRFPVLSAEKEAYLSLVIQNSDDARLVEKATFIFVASNIRWASWITKHHPYYVAITSFDEAWQAAFSGIFSAVQRFDSLYGNKFSTFSYYIMRRAIQKTVCERYSMVGLEVITNLPKTLWQIRTFEEDTGRKPTILELVAMTGKRPNLLQKIIDGYKLIHRDDSLSRPLTDDGSLTLEDTLGEEDSGGAEVETVSSFFKISRYLSADERELLNLVIVNQEMTIEEYAVAREMSDNVAQAQYNRILSLLRHPFFGIGGALSDKLAWQEDAQCAKEKYIAITGIDPKQQPIATICGRCIVREACLELAKSTRPPVTLGVWGGKNKQK